MNSSGDTVLPLSNSPVQRIRPSRRPWEDIFKRQNCPENIHSHLTLQTPATGSGLVCVWHIGQAATLCSIEVPWSQVASKVPPEENFAFHPSLQLWYPFSFLPTCSFSFASMHLLFPSEYPSTSYSASPFAFLCGLPRTDHGLAYNFLTLCLPIHSLFSESDFSVSFLPGR